jgi:lipopolysaccharide heptosyltransferase II
MLLNGQCRMSVKPKNILILRLSSIGDILLTTAFVRQTRKALPVANITYVVKKEFQGLLKYNPNITKIIAYDSTTKIKGLKSLNLFFRETNYDLVFDLHNNMRTNRVLSGIDSKKIFKIKKNKIKRALLVYLKINSYKSIKTIPERYLDVGSTCGVKDDGLGLELFLSKENKKNDLAKSKKYDLIPSRYICFGPGAAHFTKMWSVNNYEKVIQKITTETDYKVALLGSSAEKGLLRSIQQNTNVVNLSGSLSLQESAEIISESAGLVSNDSGLTHMAAALQKPVLAIFGSTVEELGFFPYRADSTIIENDLWCRPCSHVGRKKCPLGHFKCMRLTTVDRVFEEVKRKLIK